MTWHSAHRVLHVRGDLWGAFPFGVDTVEAGLVLPRHRHVAGYATVVLTGTVEEASFAGRFVAGPGDVLLHGAFDCHANRTLMRRAPQIIRLPWPDNRVEGRYRVRDPDELARLAERNVAEALNRLRVELMSVPKRELDWTEQLAEGLREDAIARLDYWAEGHDLAPETVSRGFHRAFGTSPKAFRLESRARRAWNALRDSPAPLTSIAHDSGFADLSHLSRAVTALTGAPPGHWRRHDFMIDEVSQVHSS